MRRMIASRLKRTKTLTDKANLEKNEGSIKLLEYVEMISLQIMLSLTPPVERSRVLKSMER